MLSAVHSSIVHSASEVGSDGMRVGAYLQTPSLTNGERADASQQME